MKIKHFTSVEQRRILSPRQDSNPIPPSPLVMAPTWCLSLAGGSCDSQWGHRFFFVSRWRKISSSSEDKLVCHLLGLTVFPRGRKKKKKKKDYGVLPYIAIY